MSPAEADQARARRHLEVDRFFDRHLQAVAVRLEWQVKRALDRQRAAWRESQRREAMLDEKDFEQTSRS